MRPDKRWSRWPIWITLAVGAWLLAGCIRDTQVAKKKYLEKGDAYFQKWQYREAAIEYQNAIQIDPRFALAHYELAQTYLRQSDWTHGYQELMRATALEPTNWQAQLDLGNLVLAAGKYLEARERAQIILKGDPQNAQAQLLLANTDAVQGDLPKALREAQEAVQLDPSRSQSYLNIAVLQEKNKDTGEAEHNFQKALALEPKSTSATMALGSFYLRQRRWSEAETQFQSAITLDPKNPMPHSNLAGLYLNEGRKDMAEQVLRDARTTLQDNPGGYRMLGDFYLSQGEVDKAIAEFASLHSEHPKDLPVTKAYVQLLIMRSRLDEATSINDSILKSLPKDIDALVLRGQILTRQGQPSDAIHFLESAIKDAPNDAMAHYYLGVAYADTSSFGQAEAEWREAARLQPQMAEAQRSLANIALRKGDVSLLSESAEQLMKIEPRAPEGYVYHSQAMLNAGEKAEAEADLKKAIDVAPDDPTAYVRLGDLRMIQKHYDEAEKFYTEALSRDPHVGDALTGLVNIDLTHEQPARALRRVEDQIAKVPSSSVYYVLLGQVQLKKGDPEKAEEGLLETRGEWQQAEVSYQRALQIQSDFPVAANNLAYLMLEHGGNVSVALSLAQTARKGLPNLPNSADTLGWAYYNQGAYSSAIDTLQEAVKADPKNPTYHYHLGMAYQKTNNIAMAKKELEHTLQISPDYGKAAEIRKMLADSVQKD